MTRGISDTNDKDWSDRKQAGAQIRGFTRATVNNRIPHIHIPFLAEERARFFAGILGRRRPVTHTQGQINADKAGIEYVESIFIILLKNTEQDGRTLHLEASAVRQGFDVFGASSGPNSRMCSTMELIAS